MQQQIVKAVAGCTQNLAVSVSVNMTHSLVAGLAGMLTPAAAATACMPAPLVVPALRGL